MVKTEKNMERISMYSRLAITLAALSLFSQSCVKDDMENGCSECIAEAGKTNTVENDPSKETDYSLNEIL